VTRRLAMLLTVIALIGASCGDDDSTDTTAAGTTAGGGGGEATIVIEDFSFAAPGSVAAGTTVTVENRDGAAHTWTATDGSFDSGTIAGGGSFQFTFDQPGEFDFMCTIHPAMQGSISVTG
jgi:plastocyanin